jgi:hypothetical protein
MGDAEDMFNGEDSDTMDGQSDAVDTIRAIRLASARAVTKPPTDDELLLATQLVRGHAVVEIPGRWSREGDPAPEPIVIPEPRSLAGYASAPCKLEVSTLKQIRHAKQAYSVFSTLDSVK